MRRIYEYTSYVIGGLCGVYGGVQAYIGLFNNLDGGRIADGSGIAALGLVILFSTHQQRKNAQLEATIHDLEQRLDSAQAQNSE